MKSDFVSTDGPNVRLSVRLQPRASRSEIREVAGSELRVNVKAPPVDGKANEALEKLRAKQLDVPRSHVSIIRGKSSHSKVVAIAGQTAEQIKQRLLN
ncbi:MAG: DUF167 domain-containing protein [Verrucomicrobiia bacterium]|jgi:uncharacterized protein (TIGR00251 family)